MNASDDVPLADRILLIEDNEDDVLLFRRLLTKARVTCGLDIVIDGETAIRWLSEKVGESACGRPVLPRAIFLDLKLPGILGTEVLRWMRAQPPLQRTLTAICTSSSDRHDLAEAERLGAHVFLAKFPNPDQLASLLAASDPRTLPAELTGYVGAH